MVDRPVHGRGHAHDEDNGHAHAQCGLNFLGNAHEGADAQELGQDEVVDQDCAQCDRKQASDTFHYFATSLVFLGLFMKY